MKYILSIILVIQTILAAKIQPSIAADTARSSVLVISSYHDGFSWSDAELQGVRDQIGDIAEIHVEYMDTKRFFSEEYQHRFLELIKYKYRDWHFDAVITLDDDAFQLMLDHKADVFSDTPLIFCGVNHFTFTMIQGRKDITGIVEETSPLETILVGLELNPTAETVWIVTDNTTTGQANRQRYESKSFQAEVPIPIKFMDENKNGLFLDELKDRLSDLPDESIVFFSDFAQDRSGQFMAPERIMPYLSETSNAPIFAMYDFYLGVGAVGGMMESGYYQGEKAGNLARQVLNGTPVNELPIVTENVSRYMFDFNQLKKWGINRNQLPPESVLINLPYQFYRDNKPLVWSIAAFIAIETLIIFILIGNIHRRKRAETSLYLSEERYRNLFEYHSSIMLVINPNSGKILDANPTASAYYGYSIEALRTMQIAKLSAMPTKVIEDRLRRLQKEKTITFYSEHKRQDGVPRHVEIHGSSIPFNSEDAFFLIINDVHARYERQNEMEASLQLAISLRSINKRKHILEQILLHTKNNLDALATAIVWQRSPIADPVIETCNGDCSLIRSETILNHAIESASERRTIKTTLQNETTENIHLVCLPLINNQDVLGVLVILRNQDFDEDNIRLLSTFGEMAANSLARSSAYEANEAQLLKLAALHDIDQSILTDTNLKGSLDEVLTQANELLGTEAGLVYMVQDQENMLELIACQGVDGIQPLKKKAVDDQDSLTGMILHSARETVLLNIHDQPEVDQWQQTDPYITQFNTIYGIPLMAQNKLKGLFLLLNRHSDIYPQDWLDFANTLAGQATIAIVNYKLIDDLKRSNENLVQAYDETIKSLAKSLELRDYETLGHSERVTKMTVEVAREFSFSSDELKEIERGALLHDIGKMAIPDDILRKEQNLSENEWGIMHRHPEIAYEMLHDIPFLENSIQIAYCHHEHWDGSGYPRGLKGKEIPLSARIFAIVDVWDALLEDRPYRNQWTKQQVVEYIKGQAGKQFDPEVVDKFLEYLAENNLL